MNRLAHSWLRALLLTLVAALAGVFVVRGALATPTRVEAVEVELVAPSLALRAGQWEWLGLRIRHDPHWHTYWRNPGDSGLATRLNLEGPEGLEVGDLQWPRPERFLIAPLASYGYESEVLLPVPVRVPAHWVGQRVEFRAEASWLMCRDVCIPGEATLRLSLPVVAEASSPERSTHAESFVRSIGLLPREKIELPAVFGPADLSIVLPASVLSPAQTVPHIEFFPYAEHGIRHAAAQRLLALPEGSEGLARLVLELSDDGRRLLADKAFARTDLALGVLVLDGRTVEVEPRVITVVPAEGRELARVEAKPVVMPTAGAGALFSAASGRGAPGWQGTAGSAGAASESSSLWLALGLAVLGGLILNLMPCVFPVIGLKVLAFASQAQAATSVAAHGLALPARDALGATRAGALAFAAGVLLSFLALGGLMLALKSAGMAAGWGFQLQSPMFVTAMALLFVGIGLNLAGVFEIGLGLTRLARFDAGSQRRRESSSYWSANAGSGALAVLVATPCTAPFMASALGFTLAATAIEALAVFAAIGLGMALPYLLLGWFPGWLRWLPRPGRWMESLRQFLAFPMFITAAWLAWVLGLQAGIDAVFALVVGAVLISLGTWCLGRFVQPRGLARARVAALVAAASLVGGVWLALSQADQSASPSVSDARGEAAMGRRDLASPGATPRESVAARAPLAWQAWSAQRVAEALAAGRPVFVDFTAAWCVSCQANKKLVLERDTVVQAMAEKGVVRLRADWTQRDAAITAELARHGRNGVPLYLLFDPVSKSVRTLPELLTVGIVAEALLPLPKK